MPSSLIPPAELRKQRQEAIKAEAERRDPELLCYHCSFSFEFFEGDEVGDPSTIPAGRHWNFNGYQEYLVCNKCKKHRGTS